MKKIFFRRVSSRLICALLFFAFLSALVFTDITRTLTIFHSDEIFTVVLDAGHGGYPLRQENAA